MSHLICEGTGEYLQEKRILKTKLADYCVPIVLEAWKKPQAPHHHQSAFSGPFYTAEQSWKKLMQNGKKEVNIIIWH